MSYDYGHDFPGLKILTKGNIGIYFKYPLWPIYISYASLKGKHSSKVMTLSLLQVQSLNFFAITYVFNTLTDFFKNLFSILDLNRFFKKINHDIQGQRNIRISVFSAP